MVAATKNYSGSPHIDSSDVRHQFAVSFGKFAQGGELCVECVSQPNKLWVVNTHNRLARVDGRAVHWVRGFDGERYSLIFFATNPADHEDLAESCSTGWIPDAVTNQ
mmetsp:Transcript_46909/g.150790  ORF Transcript_46909/g.150790 Transcript_46909/m.150790 type:complete len:107 (-) Transcript_46909:71-391(-)